MKTLIALLLLLVFVCSNASAVIRPRFPHRAYPPMGANISNLANGFSAKR